MVADLPPSPASRLLQLIELPRLDAPTFTLNDNLSFEDALAHAADLLHCAVETVQASGEVLSVQQRAVMHLVGMAKGVVDRALDCTQSR